MINVICEENSEHFDEKLLKEKSELLCMLLDNNESTDTLDLTILGEEAWIVLKLLSKTIDVEELLEAWDTNLMHNILFYNKYLISGCFIPTEILVRAIRKYRDDKEFFSYISTYIHCNLFKKHRLLDDWEEYCTLVTLWCEIAPFFPTTIQKETHPSTWNLSDMVQSMRPTPSFED